VNRPLLRLLLAALALLAVAAAFAAYQQPALFFDFVNLRYCA
jgi:hypothetical protein